ncbi:MAG: methyl-accepting chemotaxis protein [Tissierellia bacterium]|nr:methyl-accepting chemotaxis protein [Tissierellia bacterium]
MNFRKKLMLVLTLMVLIASVLTSVIGFLVARKTQFDAMEEVLRINGELVRDNMHRWMTENTGILDSINQSITARYDRFEDIEDKDLDFYDKESGIISIYAIPDNRGEIRDSGNWRPEAGDDMTTRDYYIGATETDGYFFSDVYVDAETKSNVITISKTIEKNGRLWGVLASDVSLQAITEFMNTLDFYKGAGTAAIISNSGLVVYHPEASILSLKAEETQQLKEIVPLIQSNMGVSFKDAYLGEEQLIFPIELDEINMIAIVAVPMNVINQNVNTMMIYFIIIMIVTLVLGAIISLFISASIGKNFESLTDFIKEISAYNLTYKAEEHKGSDNDEFVIMQRNLNMLRDNLIHHIDELDDKNRRIQDASNGLSQISTQVLQGSEDITRVVSDLSDTSESQAHDTEAGANQMHNLSKEIEMTANLIKSVGDSTKEVVDNVSEGRSVIDELVHLTLEGGNASKEVFEIVKQTETNSQRIGDASKLISDIADQTNLLALNAAIEAARAGEAGRGFSVVADEIRKLAEESAKSTHIIAESVEELINSAVYAVEKMVLLENITNSQNSEAKDAKIKFNEIENAINTVNEAIKMVEESTTSMETNKDAVLGVLESLAAVAEENAASTEETAATTESQNEKMQDIEVFSSNLRIMADELSAEVNKFTR